MKYLFISLEIAQLAKEKGFDEPCLAIYFNENSNNAGYIKEVEFTVCNEETIHESNWEDATQFLSYTNSKLYPQYTAAPLYQQIVDWFREKHDIHISMEIYKRNGVNVYGYVITYENFSDEKLGDDGIHEEDYNKEFQKAILEAFKLI